MAETMRNIGALFGDTKTRNIILITGLIMIGAVAVGVFGFKRSRPPVPTAGVEVAQNLGNIQSVPGIAQATPAQAQLQTQLNDQRYQSETSKGKSFLPTIISTGTSEDGSASKKGQGKSLTFSPTGSSKNGKGKGEQQDKATQAQINALQQQVSQQQQQLKAQQAESQAQQRQQALEQTQEGMRTQAQSIMAAWNGGSGNPTQQYVAGEIAEEAKALGKNGKSSAGNGAEGEDSEKDEATKPTGPAVIKAGDIAFAVLNTSVNSDEPGPVLATIVGGKYSGSKLIGSIQKPATITGVKQSAVTLTFNTMSVPKQPNSTSVSAVAIDPDTARTAVASDVDKHYLQRYGTLFASSFLEGYGNAITSSGSVAFTPSTGGTTTFQQQLDPTEEFMAALGEVGTTLGQQLEDVFDRPYTITVDSGTSLGILFLTDVTNLGTD